MLGLGRVSARAPPVIDNSRHLRLPLTGVRSFRLTPPSRRAPRRAETADGRDRACRRSLTRWRCLTSADPDQSRQGGVLRRSAHVHGHAAAGRHPPLGARVPVGERAPGDRDLHAALTAGWELHPGEARELLRGVGTDGVGSRPTYTCATSAPTRSPVFSRRHETAASRVVDLQARVGERRVRQAVAERVRRLDAAFQEPAVADEHALGEFGGDRLDRRHWLSSTGIVAGSLPDGLTSCWGWRARRGGRAAPRRPPRTG